MTTRAASSGSIRALAPHARRVTLVVAAAAALLWPAVPTDAAKRKRSRYRPAIVVIRNDSHGDIARVTLREKAKRADRATRLGSIAPVPRGASQSVGGSTSDAPLPRRIVVTWVDAAGRTFESEVDLRDALDGAIASLDEALVFRIGPGNVLTVATEPVAPP